ncbi:MAG: DUF4381 domain-containing protein [Gammaproteobacteria bacterium]|nr:DUF4381 domain-containing protein [Gammaproteobacteria bacterium]
MNSATPTAALELRDIHLPEPISWWPLAPGWWFLLGGILFIILAVFLYQRYQKKQALKKQVLAEFETIRAQYNKEKNSTALVQSLSILLRRACISFYPRSEAASLTGESWLQFLDSTGDEKAFSTNHGQLIASAPYLAENTELNFDAEKLVSLCENWLKAQPNKNHIRAGEKS